MGMMALLLFKTPAVQPEKLSEGEPIDIKEGSGCDKKDVAVPEEMTPVKKKFTLKEFSVTFHNIESIYDKMLEADLN